MKAPTFYNMLKYYKMALLWPTVITCILSGIFGWFDSKYYESEWFTPESGISLAIIIAIGYCIVLAACSLPLFLNQISTIRQNPYLSGLCWLIGPLIIAFTTIGYELLKQDKDKAQLIFNLILNFPILTGLIYSYLKFKHDYDR